MSTETVSDDAPEEPSSSDQDAVGAPARPTGRDKRINPHLPFLDREKAAEAGRRGAEATNRLRRERQLEAELAEAAAREGAAPDVVAAVRAGASAADAATIRALEKAAAKGDVQAARVLLDWRKLDVTQGAGIEAVRLLELFGQLDTQGQAALRSMLAELLDEQASREVAA